MPKVIYERKKFVQWQADLIQKAIEIVDSYHAKGYDLTLRQVYYQFVARDWLPERWRDEATGSTNNVRSYKNLGNLLGDARMAGVMDWKTMVDRTRAKYGMNHWSSPSSVIASAARGYHRDKWETQDNYVEVWVEKDALEGVVARVCNRLDISYFSCRGYTSLTSIWENAQFLKSMAAEGRVPHVLHLGDHDPSGIDMSRDIEERVRNFMDGQGKKLVFDRVALNMDQVEQYTPPENPAKVTDSRYIEYKRTYGESCWELDALEPTVIDGLIASKVDALRDDEKFNDAKAQEDEERELLTKCSDEWMNVVDFLENPDDWTKEGEGDDE